MNTSNVNIGKCKICQSDAIKWCTNCRNVQYCSVECQKSDWKSHKPNCWPVQIITEGETRKLVTTREVQEHELILSEAPILIGPDCKLAGALQEQLGQARIIICLTCNTDISHHKNRCSKCQWPVCNATCQRDPRHAQRECKIFQVYPVQETARNNHFVGIVRILFLKSTDPAKWNKILQLKLKDPDPESKDFGDTEIQFGKMLKTFFAQLSIKLSVEECVHGINVWASAWASSPLHGGKALQNELYYILTFITQDCLPNTKKLIQQSPGKEQRLNFYAKSKLSPGTTLTQTWRFDDNFPTGTWYRRYLVYKQGGGWCKCFLCSDPTENNSYASALKCPNHSRATNVKACLLPINPLDQDSEWECNTCKEIFPRTKMLDILDPINIKLNSLIDQARRQFDLIDVGGADAESAESIVKIMMQYDKELNSVVHPNHHCRLNIRVQILTGLFNLSCPMGRPVPLGEVGGGKRASAGMIIFWKPNQRENMEKMHKIVLEVLPVIEAIAPDTFTHYRVMYYHAIARWTYVALTLGQKSTDSNSAARQVLNEAEALTEELKQKFTSFKNSKNVLPVEPVVPEPYIHLYRNLKQLDAIEMAFTQSNLNFRGMRL